MHLILGGATWGGAALHRCGNWLVFSGGFSRWGGDPWAKESGAILGGAALSALR